MILHGSDGPRNVPRVYGGKGGENELDGDSIYSNKFQLQLPKLYKKGTKGWMELSITFHFEHPTEAVVITEIAETGMKTRVFKSQVSTVSSKPYIMSVLQNTRSRWNRKKDRDGWSLEKEEPEFKEPMLLHKWENEKNKKGPWLVSPKMDGIRATFYPKSGKLVSRKRMPFDMGLLVHELKQLGLGLDGELWSKGLTFEQITGTVKRDTLCGIVPPNVIGKRQVHFNVFDRTDMDAPYVDRLASLYDHPSLETDMIHVVKCVYCETEEQVDEAFEKFRDLGYEGAVARTLDYKWQWDVRSHDILKVKKIFSEEFVCVDVTHDGDATFGDLISFIFRKDGKRFKATPAWGKQRRHNEWMGATNYKGKTFRVDYRDLTANGIPKHAVAVGLREEGE